MRFQLGPNSELRRYAWSPPFTDWHPEIGDTIDIQGDVAKHMRGGSPIAVRLTSYVVETGEIAPVVDPPHTISESFVIWRTHVPLPFSMTLLQSVRNSSDDSITFFFGDGTDESAASFAAGKAAADDFFSNPVNAKAILKAVALARSEEGSNMGACNGMTITLDHASAAIVDFGGVPNP